MVKLAAGRTETYEPVLRHGRDEAGGVPEWEFMCECGHESCHETVFLTLDRFEAFRDQGQAVLADGHEVSPVARHVVSEARPGRSAPRQSIR